MLVVIEQIDKTGPNGDRDTQRHPYSDYNIHMLKAPTDPPTDETLIQTIEGFDNFACHIKDKQWVRNQAVAYAKRLAKPLGAEVKWATDLVTKEAKFKTIRAVVECRVPEHITEKALVNALERVLLYPIQLGFKGNPDTLVKPKFKSYSRVRTAEKRNAD